MTGDPAEEAERRRQMRGLESRERHLPPAEPGQPPNDPVHIIRTDVPDRPGAFLYSVARWSVVARLASNAADEGSSEVTDLGGYTGWVPVLPRDVVLRVGVRDSAGRWLAIFEGYERVAEGITGTERGLSWPGRPG